MEVVHKVRVEDKTKIKNIRFKYPDIVGEDAGDNIKREYEELLNAKVNLSKARAEVRELEKIYDKLEKEWMGKQHLFDIEFESFEKEVKTGKSNLLFKGLTYKYDY